MSLTRWEQDAYSDLDTVSLSFFVVFDSLQALTSKRLQKLHGHQSRSGAMTNEPYKYPVCLSIQFALYSRKIKESCRKSPPHHQSWRPGDASVATALSGAEDHQR